jgi:hypothetical protein
MLIEHTAWLAFRGVEVLLAWSLGVQTIEFLRMSHALVPPGVWVWSVQQRDIPQLSMRRLFDGLYQARVFQILLWLRLVAVIVLAVNGGSLGLILFLFTGHLLILIRWRGAFNGGSDFMTLVALTGLLVGYLCWWGGQPLLGMKAALWYITLNAVTSYFMSGWVKTLRPEWRNGSAMTIFLNAAIYGPLSPDHWLRREWITLIGSWSFIVWEGLFPLGLLHPLLAIGFCSVAALFHFLVFWFFGLNRFFWAWMVSFPAIIWSSWVVSVGG